MGREREGEMEEDFSKQKLELDGYHDNGDSKLSCWKRKLTLLSLDSSIRNGERSTDAGKNNSANFRSLNQIVIHPHDWYYFIFFNFIFVIVFLFDKNGNFNFVFKSTPYRSKYYIYTLY